MIGSVNNLHYCFEVTFTVNPETYYLLDKDRSLEPFYSKMETLMEPVLQLMGANDDVYTVVDKYSQEITYLFHVKLRRRLGRLKNLLDKYITFESLPKVGLRNLKKKAEAPILQSVSFLRKETFEKKLAFFQSHPGQFEMRQDASTYRGEDITVLNDKKNWFKWQTKLYELLFDKNGDLRKAKEREIIFIEDKYGNSGKSTFWKWLYVFNHHEIGLLSEASSSQLKANIVKLGPKKLYVIDLPRTEGDVGTKPLVNTLESLKNGVINTSMYGSSDVMIMDPPLIVITGNSMPISSWTPDRWVVYSIDNTKNKDWKDISKERRAAAIKSIDIESRTKLVQMELRRINLEQKENKVKNYQPQLST